ncbi:MAG: GAF domain-containing protein [Bradymonadales bacterium]|nr:MAG: GAF domain-containing protein [Bradymonadales bacterium]
MSDLSLRRPHTSNRVFKSYLDFLADEFPEIDCAELCKEAGLDLDYLSDENAWSSIVFDQRFTSLAKFKSGFSDICYEVGKRAISKERIGLTIYFWGRYALTTEEIYLKIPGIISMFNRLIRCEVLSGRPGFLEVRLDFDDRGLGPEEKHALQENIPNVLDNLRGYFEAIPSVHRLPPAQVLIVKDDRGSAYNIKVSYEHHRPLLKRAAWWVFSGFVAGLSYVYLSPYLEKALLQLGFGLLILSLLCLLKVWGSKLLLQKVAKSSDETVKQLDRQYSILHRTKEELQRRLQETELLNKVIQSLVQTSSRGEIIDLTCRLIQQILGYDRALIFLVDKEGRSLRCEGSIGLDDRLAKALGDFRLPTEIESSDPYKLTNVFRKKQGILVEDVATHLKELLPESQNLLKMVESRSFVAVPICTEEQAFGILCVDFYQQHKRLGPDDLKLMSGVAYQIALALDNVGLVDQLKENLEVTNRFSLEQQNLRKIFQKFVPKNISSGLVNLSNFEFQEAFLKRVKRESVTVMFLDVFNFSRLSAELEPEMSVELLNLSFSLLTPCVEKWGGFVDKYTGDGLLAVFQGERSAREACFSALQMIHQMGEINKKLEAKNLPSIGVGIGLHHGPVILGNIGSDTRLNFTVIGDTVNLASRFESYTRKLGPNRICASEVVRLHAGDQLLWEALGEVELKGSDKKWLAYSLRSTQAEKLVLGGKASES